MRNRSRRPNVHHAAAGVAVALLASLAGCASGSGGSGGDDRNPEAARTTTLFVLRHAETPKPPAPDPGPDPELTPAGAERAQRLAALLSSAGIDRILSTDYVRTRSTVAPLGEAVGLMTEMYDPRALRELATELVGSGERVVIVGHSNTTPAMVAALGGDPGEPIDDATEFDRLYVVTVRGEEASTVLLRY